MPVLSEDEKFQLLIEHFSIAEEMAAKNSEGCYLTNMFFLQA